MNEKKEMKYLFNDYEKLILYLINTLDSNKLLTILLINENDILLYDNENYKTLNNENDIIETFNNIKEYLRKNKINSLYDLLENLNNDLKFKNDLIKLLEN